MGQGQKLSGRRDLRTRPAAVSGRRPIAPYGMPELDYCGGLRGAPVDVVRAT